MARRKSFSGIIASMAREAARAERERNQEIIRRQKEIERQNRLNLKIQQQNEKIEKLAYLDARLEEAETINEHIQDKVLGLRNILEHTLSIDDTISFNQLRKRQQYKLFHLPKELEAPIEKPSLEDYISAVPVPGKLIKLIPGRTKKYEESLQEAKEKYNKAYEAYEVKSKQREELIQQLRTQYETEKNEHEKAVNIHNAEIDQFEEEYRAGEPQAVSAYSTMVLERSEYPDGFPQEFKVAYLLEPKEMVVEYQLPNLEVIPSVESVKYVKTRDSIDEKQRSIREIKSLYQDVISAVCLRTIHELFESDQAEKIDVVTFNGFVQTVDPATGQDIRPYLISVRTTKDVFSHLILDRIEKSVCLRNLGARVSPHASELQAIKPVVDFDMVDNRFIEQSDVLSDLESRPNLMELNPFEFENFISNLFELIGFESKLTRSSRDGGIDVVAYDSRPILGGKVVIQAKRYKNVVGVSAVRDLYGSMINEGANKGILVTTSHYGPDAYEFSKDKPIELIDGGGLLYLLKQHDIEAKIIFPDDWTEPTHS